MHTTYNAQQIQAAVAALNAHLESSFVSHEWEELVFRLCNDSDPRLREKMSHEKDTILEKDPGFKAFWMN